MRRQTVRNKQTKTGEMKNQKNLKAEDERRQVVIINRPFVSPQQRCDKCTEPSGMITPDEAAALWRVSTRTVYRWLETGAIHFSEASQGTLLICLNSLATTNISPDGRQPELNSRM